MTDLNIRNVPPELLAKLKSDAALNRETLRDWCIDLLGGKGHEREAVAVSVRRIKTVADAQAVKPNRAVTGHHPRCQCTLCAERRD